MYSITSAAYPLQAPIVSICCEYLVEDPLAIRGFLETQQGASSGEVAKARYCFKTYVTHRLQNDASLTTLSKHNFVAETVVYATQRSDLDLLNRALACFDPTSPPETRLCMWEISDVAPYRPLQFACIRRALSQLGPLDKRCRLAAFQCFTKEIRYLGPSHSTHALILRYLRDPDFTASLLPLLTDSLHDENYVFFIRAMCEAAAYCGLNRVIVPSNENAYIPRNAERDVNAALALPSLEERLNKIRAIFPRFRPPSSFPDCYGNAPYLQAILRQLKTALLRVKCTQIDRKCMNAMLESMAKYPQLDILTSFFTDPLFIAFVENNPHNSIDIGYLFGQAASLREWGSVAYLIQQAENLGLKIYDLSIKGGLRHAIADGNAEAVEMLMQHPNYIYIPSNEIYALMLLAIATGNVGITFLLLQSHKILHSGFWVDFLKATKSLAMMKMLMDDPRFQELDSSQLLNIFVLSDMLKEEKMIPLFTYLAQSHCFKKLNTEEIGLIFTKIQTLGHFNALQATGRLEEMSGDTIQWAIECRLRDTEERSDLGLIHALFQTSQFKRFTSEELNKIYVIIINHRKYKILALFIASSRFKDVNPAILGEELIKAAAANDGVLVTLMVSSPHAAKISAEHIVDALTAVSKLEIHEALRFHLTFLIQSLTFRKLPLNEIEKIFEEIRTLEHFNLLKAAGLLEEISDVVVERRLLFQVERFYDLDLVQALFHTPQFERFTHEQLNRLYMAMSETDNDKMVEAFLASSRFKDVDAVTLGQALVKAVKGRKVAFVALVVTSPHSRKISANHVLIAFVEAAKANSEQIKQILSSRWRRNSG